MLLTELANHFKYAQIITHTDLDGYGAGAVLVNMLVELGFDIDNIKVTNTAYSNPLPFNDEYRFFLISDISISNKESAEKLLKYANREGNLVLWFDHHQTSIDMYEKYPDLKNVLGDRKTAACGAYLSWLFYRIVINLLQQPKALDTSIEYASEYLQNTNSYFIQTLLEKNEHACLNDYVYQNEKGYQGVYFGIVPYGIVLTDDYDRFELRHKESIYLMEAFNSYPEFRKDCKSDYFRYNYLNANAAETYSFITAGKKLFYWKKISMLNTIKSNGFIASFPIEGMQDIKMLCVNSTNKSSLMFGNCYGPGYGRGPIQYKYCCIYCHNGKNFTVSIYCADPKEPDKKTRKIGIIYNAMDICKRFDGGGHPGASGFVTDHLNFVDISPLPKMLKDQIDNEIKELMDEVSNI